MRYREQTEPFIFLSTTRKVVHHRAKPSAYVAEGVYAGEFQVRSRILLDCVLMCRSSRQNGCHIEKMVAHVTPNCSISGVARSGEEWRGIARS